MKTATDDLKFKLTTQDFWCREVNIHFITNAARYGNLNITSSYPSISAGDGISFQDCNLNEIYFMNSTAGSNATIVAICIEMSANRRKDLGVGVA